MAVATSMSAVGMLATVGMYFVLCLSAELTLQQASVISLRNSFGSSAEAVKAWDVTKTLDSSLLSAFALLVSQAIP